MGQGQACRTSVTVQYYFCYGETLPHAADTSAGKGNGYVLGTQLGKYKEKIIQNLSDIFTVQCAFGIDDFRS